MITYNWNEGTKVLAIEGLIPEENYIIEIDYIQESMEFRVQAQSSGIVTFSSIMEKPESVHYAYIGFEEIEEAESE